MGANSHSLQKRYLLKTAVIGGDDPWLFAITTSSFERFAAFIITKSKDHISCLQKRLKLWKDSNLNDLVLEGRAIQQRLNGKPHRGKLSRDSDSREAYLFAKP